MELDNDFSVVALKYTFGCESYKFEDVDIEIMGFAYINNTPHSLLVIRENGKYLMKRSFSDDKYNFLLCVEGKLYYIYDIGMPEFFVQQLYPTYQDKGSFKHTIYNGHYDIFQHPILGTINIKITGKSAGQEETFSFDKEFNLL